MYLSYILADIGYNLQEWNFVTLLLVLVGWASLVYRIHAEEQLLSLNMPNGQPTSSWSATAFSRAFGESAARIPAGLPYRTIFLLPTAIEDRLSTG